MNFPWQSDGPGFTNHPRVDISTHRSRAKSTQRLGLLVFALGIVVGVLQLSPWFAIAGFAFWALSTLSAYGLRLQALEWEVELETEGER